MLSTELKYYLDPEYLEQIALQYHQEYAEAEPFPHIVIDNFLPEAILDKVLAEFPKANSIDWQTFNSVAEKKLANNSELQMGENTRFLLYQLNSSTFINFLENLTGIEGILPDPHFIGGGLHQIEKGGYLKIHVDFNKHGKLNLDRRLNLLIYLNKDWSEEYGGYFEMWDTQMEGCRKKVLPIFNRCVIFNTTNVSFHGHPEPLTCPEGRTRKSLALYYYSSPRQSEEDSETHSTLFQARPNENLTEKITWLDRGKTLFKKFIPPIFIELRQSLTKND